MPGTLTDADIAAHEPQTPATLTDADIAKLEPSDPFGTLTSEQYSKLPSGEHRIRQGIAKFAQDHPYIFGAIRDAYITTPGGVTEMGVPGATASIPARDLLNATSAFFKAGGKDMAAGGAKAAGGAVLAHMGPLGEFGNAMAGGGLFTKGAAQAGKGIKAGFGAAREALSTPEAESLDTSALPVRRNPLEIQPHPLAPAGGPPQPLDLSASGSVEYTPLQEPPIGEYPEGVGIHGGVEGQPIPGRMDDLLADMRKKLGARDIPASQDRYDVGSGAPLIKPRAKAAKAAAGGSLEDQLSASVEKAQASKTAPENVNPELSKSENYKPGDTVWLPNRGHVLITKLNGDGTFDYTMSK